MAKKATQPIAREQGSVANAPKEGETTIQDSLQESNDNASQEDNDNTDNAEQDANTSQESGDNADNAEQQSSSEQNIDVQQTLEASKDLVIVIAGAGYSAELAKLATEKYSELAEVLVIGDDIPCECSSDDPNLSYIEQLIAAVASDKVPERFVFVPAGTLPINGVKMADLEVLKAWDLNGNRRQEHEKVVDKLKRFIAYFLPLDMPFVYEKSKVAELIETFVLDTNILNFPTAYFGYFEPENVPYNASVASSEITGLVLRKKPDMNVVEDYLKRRKFLVCSNVGFEAIKDLLQNK